MSLPRTRFAPSPTGPLHRGHALSALWAARRAQKVGGEILIRIEDIDHTRARDHWIEDIWHVMHFLGLESAEHLPLQSQRLPAYASALQRLKDLGLVYPCTCTRAQILAAQPDSSLPYPGTCRGKGLYGEAKGEASWRLNLACAFEHIGERQVTWQDMSAGEQHSDFSQWGDVVLARRDIGTSYHLAHVIDDADQGISHVTRGMDLFDQTPIHVLVQQLLGLPQPIYDHHPLIYDRPGQKLSKRNGATSLMSAVREGLTLEALLGEMREYLRQMG